MACNLRWSGKIAPSVCLCYSLSYAAGHDCWHRLLAHHYISPSAVVKPQFLCNGALLIVNAFIMSAWPPRCILIRTALIKVQYSRSSTLALPEISSCVSEWQKATGCARRLSIQQRGWPCLNKTKEEERSESNTWIAATLVMSFTCCGSAQRQRWFTSVWRWG